MAVQEPNGHLQAPAAGAVPAAFRCQAAVLSPVMQLVVMEATVGLMAEGAAEREQLRVVLAVPTLKVRVVVAQGGSSLFLTSRSFTPGQAWSTFGVASSAWSAEASVSNNICARSLYVQP